MSAKKQSSASRPVQPSTKSAPATPPPTTPNPPTLPTEPSRLKKVRTTVSKVYTYVSERVRKKLSSTKKNETAAVTPQENKKPSTFSLKKMVLVLSGLAACFTVYYYWDKVSFGPKTPIEQSKQVLAQTASTQAMQEVYLNLARKVDAQDARLLAIEKQSVIDREDQHGMRKEISGKLAVISHSLEEQKKATSELKNALKEFETGIQSLVKNTRLGIAAVNDKIDAHIEIDHGRVASTDSKPKAPPPIDISNISPKSETKAETKPEKLEMRDARGSWVGYRVPVGKESTRYARTDLFGDRIRFDNRAARVIGLKDGEWIPVEPPFDWRTLTSIYYVKIVPKDQEIIVWELKESNNKYEL